MLPIQENIHLTNVFMLMNDTVKMLVVLYFLVISLQEEVNDTLELMIILTKSHPNSSAAQVKFDKTWIKCFSPL